MLEQTLRIAMGQMSVKSGDPTQNLQRACEMIQEARKLNCDIIVLPECMDLGWTYPDARRLAKTIPGDYSELLCEAARGANMYVVAGLTEKYGDQLFNAAILISSDGEILSKHRKINELEIAHDLYSIGDSLSVARTPLGVIAINICADNAPNSLALGHAQARMGAQLLLSPSSWAVPSEHDNTKEPYGVKWMESYTFLSKLYNIPIIGVSNVGLIVGGVWDGKKCIGCSLAVGSDGEMLAQGPYGDQAEALILIECKILERQHKGTAFKKSLASKGYIGH